ncbi:hypothetical protein GN956_G9319 [Arapaima gigas]
MVSRHPRVLEGSPDRMLIGPALAIIFLLGPSSAQKGSAPCRCSPLGSSGLRVDCSSQGLTDLPSIPPDATELHLQHNQLRSVRPGLFDALRGLRMVNLSDNPWNCGCNIQYLRVWLQDHGTLAGRPTCKTPAALAIRAIAELSEADLPDCSLERCVNSLLDIVIILLMAVLMALLLWCLRTIKNSIFTFGVNQRHMDVDKDHWRSFEGKDSKRGRLREAKSTPMRTDDLPQMLNILHKKQGKKIKTF